MDDEFKCEARVTFRGEVLQLNKIVARIDLDDILPPRGPFDLMDLGPYNATERRKRFVDLIASEFAHALTEALFKVKR